MNGSHTTYASVGMGGAGAIVLPWLLKVTTGLEMPPEVAVSLDTLLAGLIGYFFHRLPQEAIK